MGSVDSFCAPAVGLLMCAKAPRAGLLCFRDRVREGEIQSTSISVAGKSITFQTLGGWYSFSFLMTIALKAAPAPKAARVVSAFESVAIPKGGQALPTDRPTVFCGEMAGRG